MADAVTAARARIDRALADLETKIAGLKAKAGVDRDDDLFAPEVAHAYRDKVLAMGGRKDAADLVADFLGRPYSFDSWAAWLAE